MVFKIFHIPSGLRVYLALWLTATILSFFLLYRNRKTCSLIQAAYWKFLLEPWKLFTFAIATSCVALAAPYSGDPTWDVPNSIIISMLTYILAPWSVAVLYRSIQSLTFNIHFWMALCFFFIPCWVYDIYILFRDKIYPPTWFNNLVISGGIVLIAGLFWNLCYRDADGLTFAFKLPEWPSVGPSPIRKIFWPCLFLCIPVLASIGWFVYMYFME